MGIAVCKFAMAIVISAPSVQLRHFLSVPARKAGEEAIDCLGRSFHCTRGHRLSVARCCPQKTKNCTVTFTVCTK